MNNAEIQIQFPMPGKWDKFELTAVFPDADGFVRTKRYTQDDIFLEWLHDFSEVVAMIAVLSNEWKELQSWARLDQVPVNSSQGEGETLMETIPGVILTVEAANPQGSRKLFTSADYSGFTITDEKVVALFNHFITNNKQES